MSPLETQSLQNFLNQLIQARGIAKDAQADALIASAIAQQPDAAYLLVQRALLMEQALNTAKTQISSLQSQMQAMQPAPSHGFLDATAWGNTPAVAPRPASGPIMASAPAPMQASVMQSPVQTATPGFFGGGMGSVLGTVAATAAGVAGGAFLFQGIEHLMHSNNGAGLMNQPGMTSLAAPVGNTTINNYYGTDQTTDDNLGVDDVATDDMSGDDGSSVV